MQSAPPTHAPPSSRFTARLAASQVDINELLDLGFGTCPEFRLLADAYLAARTPVPDWAVNQVLLSTDLMPSLFASLEVKDHAAALVCKAWGRTWKQRAAQERRLHAAPCPAPDFEMGCPVAVAALPGGERMAIASRGARDGSTLAVGDEVHIVDRQMMHQRSLGKWNDAAGTRFSFLEALAAGDDGLYVSEMYPSRLRRFTLDTFAVAASFGDGYHGFSQLAFAPNGVLFARALKVNYDCELLALDALSLAVRFTVGEDVLGGDHPDGLAVGGDELYVGNQRTFKVRVLSLDGKPRRVISSPAGGWRMPASLCCVADRLYLIEDWEVADDFLDKDDDEPTLRAKRMAGRRVFALTREGTVLHVHDSPRRAGQDEEVFDSNNRWMGMAHFGGRLIVANAWEEELFALEGL